MAITEQILNQDVYFQRAQGDKIILNDLNLYSVTDINLVNKMLMTVYNSDVISTVPSCDCGYYHSTHKVGEYCPKCGTKAVDPYKKTQPLLWLKSFDKSIKLLNPIFWLMLKRLLHKKIDYVRWMCDHKYNPPTKLPLHMVGIRDILQGVRTYPNFLSKIGQIIEYLLNHSKYKSPDKQLELLLLADMWHKRKKELFSDHMAIVNKQLFVMVNNSKGRFTNLMISDIISSVMLWIKTASVDEPNIDNYNLVTGQVLSKLSEMYYDYYKKYVASKQGGLRKHIYGARSHFTFRHVITAMTGPHNYYNIEVPWVTGVVVFRPHILNKLVTKYNLTYKAAVRTINSAAKRYIEIVDIVLKELIQESGDKRGIPVLGHRNPTLLQSSFLLLYISRFKTDINDKTVSLSPLVVKHGNGDYDGDDIY